MQGVAFRYRLCDEADRRGVFGWVRNCPDGSVEALFEGEEESVQAVVAWCHQGPPAAEVEKVQVREEPYTGEYRSFRITY